MTIIKLNKNNRQDGDKNSTSLKNEIKKNKNEREYKKSSNHKNYQLSVKLKCNIYIA